MQSPPFPVTSSLLGHKTTGKIVVLYILIFKFLDSNLGDKRFCTSWLQNLLLISSAIEFCFVKVAPKYLNSSTLSKVLLSVLTLWIRPAFWSRDITMYLDLSALTSSPISLVAATKASAFSFRVCMLPPSILTSSAKARSWCVSTVRCIKWLTVRHQRMAHHAFK